jgi:hypothetical protein
LRQRTRDEHQELMQRTLENLNAEPPDRPVDEDPELR